MFRLLLIDDEPRVARALEFAMTGRDVELVTITKPDNIAEQVAMVDPDAILLDIGLVGVDGLDICRRLKYDSRFGKIPVLILSGQTDATTKASSYAAGADDFVTKPFIPTDLLARVEAQLRRVSAR